jgi:hypothetical protein
LSDLSRDCVAQRLDLFGQSGRAIDGALNLLLSSPLSPTTPGVRDADILQKFLRNSDYYGKDIFEASNTFTPIQLAMFWAHKSTHDLRYLERSQSVPVESYGNLLKSAWLLRRLFEDRRLETGCDGQRSIIVILAEEVLYQIKNLVELNLSFPPAKQLMSEADFRIWIDDLEDYEERSEDNDDDEQKTIRTPPNKVEVPLPNSPDSYTLNHGLVAPVIPGRSERRQSPNGISDRPNGIAGRADSVLNGTSDSQNRTFDVPPHRNDPSPDPRPLEQLPNRAYMEPPRIHGMNGNNHAPDINRQTSNPSSTGSAPWQSPPLQPPSLMPRVNHARRKPLPEVPSPKADTHSNSSRRSYSQDSSANTQTHISQQLHPNRSQPPNSMQYGVPPLQQNHNHNQNFSNHLNTQLRRPIEEDSALQLYDPRFPPDTMYSAVSPSQDTMSFFNHRGLDPRDNDERPGEVEIMNDVFSKM